VARVQEEVFRNAPVHVIVDVEIKIFCKYPHDSIVVFLPQDECARHSQSKLTYLLAIPPMVHTISLARPLSNAANIFTMYFCVSRLHLKLLHYLKEPIDTDKTHS